MSFRMGAAWPLVIPAALSAQLSFVEVASQSGFGDYDMPRRGFGAGIAAADFDDDGDVDVFLPTARGLPDQLYRNLGDGSFEEVAAELGLAGIELGRGALWFDYDGDAHLDLLVTGDCYQRDCDGVSSFLRLYRQTESGLFLEVTMLAGLADPGHTADEHRGGAAAGDVNSDGYLDLVTGFWAGKIRLYLNQGDGSFADLSTANGFDDAVLGYHQPVMLDMNGDGRLDIYTTVDFTENRLWLHQGTTGGVPSFADVAGPAGCGNAMNDMGVAVGDVDDDGDPDVYVTNIFRDGRHNVLLRNDTAGTIPAYTEISQETGVGDGGWGWGTTFFDADNDGFLDLAETNGWRFRNWDHPPRLFMNQRKEPVTFLDRAPDAGLTGISWGSSLVAFDYDRDGDLDLMQTVNPDSLALYQNQLITGTPDHHYLVIRPRMAGRNVRAIGARVVVEAGGRTMSRWITAGTSYLGQEPAEAFFGLGGARRADRVTVSWPGGGISVWSHLPADQTLTLDSTTLFADGFELGDTSSWRP